MSVPELYEAYAAGRITRGAFIRRMMAFGMTASVAGAYAAAVRPPAALAAGQGRDCTAPLYGQGDEHRSLYGNRNLYGRNPNCP